jgi:hypothetical protein
VRPNATATYFLQMAAPGQLAQPIPLVMAESANQILAVSLVRPNATATYFLQMAAPGQLAQPIPLVMAESANQITVRRNVLGCAEYLMVVGESVGVLLEIFVD